MSYWLYNGFDNSEGFDQFGDYNELLGEAPYKPYHEEVIVETDSYGK